MAAADPAAERAVLAGIFAHGNPAWLDASDLISSSTFTIDSNAVLYRCLAHLVSDHPQVKPDLPSVLSAAHSLGLAAHFSDPGETKHLRAVLNMGLTVELSSVRRLAGKIRKLEVARLLDRSLLEASASLQKVTGEETIANIVGLAENPIFNLTGSLAEPGSLGIVPMGEGAGEYLSYLMDNPRETVGISTGLAHFDRAIGGGLREECLDIIAARQKAGKTLIVDNVGVNISRQGIPVLNVDTEMSRPQHLVRVAANMARLDIHKIEQGKYANDPIRRRRLERAAQELASLPYDYLAASGLEFDDILAFMRRWVLLRVGLGENGRARPCVILYDWLKLNSESSINRHLAEHQLLGFVTSGLKNFMTRYGARCLCFAQLNREGIDTEDTSVIRGSDRILDFCTSFSIFKGKTDAEIGEQAGDVVYTHKLIPLICRFGPGLPRNAFIHIEAVYEQGRITEGPDSSGRMMATRPQGEILVDGEILPPGELS